MHFILTSTPIFCPQNLICKCVTVPPRRLQTEHSNQGHCSDYDPLLRCSEEEEKKGASVQIAKEREGVSLTVFCWKKLGFSLAASQETQSRISRAACRRLKAVKKLPAQ
ncbi:hypothetical protein AMECASPLE_023722 [Ameca splendens]|uniref:Uncharacterized protein n=1 Tax=Ameca splendens TaxID=208324 RepID=A0ABV0ZE25_9TELE